MRKIATITLACFLVATAALFAVGGSLSGPVRWSPDGLFYQARSLELRGLERDESLERTFGGPIGAELRRIDPHRSGDPAWVKYFAPFYERRIAVPLAAAALDPVAGDRAILNLSIAGYVMAMLAVFALLLMRFSVVISVGVTLATLVLPMLTRVAGLPLTDSWGLAFETAAFASAMLVLERGPRWLVAWGLSILLLSVTRDSVWIPILAVAWLAFTLRSRRAVALLASGVASAAVVLLAYALPMRELLAAMLNDFEPNPDGSWGFIVSHYPSAIVDLLRDNGGFVRDGEWYAAAFLGFGLLALFLLARTARSGRDDALTLLRAGAVAGVLYVLAVPVFSAFRLEIVCVPMAAFGLGLAAQRAADGVQSGAWRGARWLHTGRRTEPERS